MAKKLIVWTVVLALSITGCNPQNPFLYGEMGIVEYRRGGSPETVTTPYKATYALYQGCYENSPGKSGNSGSLPAVERMPGDYFERAEEKLFEGVLSCSDQIGFEKGDDGKLVAIAGSKRIPLDDKDYCWYTSSEPEFEGFEWLCHETCLNGFNYAPVLLWPVTLPVMVPVYAVVGVGVLGFVVYQVAHDACSGEGPQGHAPNPDSAVERPIDGK